MIPAEALSQHVAVVGTVGSGKTYAAKGAIVEPLLEQQRRVCVVDPTGAWWGLRLLADGKTPGFKIAILGGEHGDVPLHETMGDKVAEMIGTRNMPAVLDLSEMLIGDRHRFMEDFAAGLYRWNRQPLHLVIDEADEFSPQNPLPETKRMLHQVDRIVRRGRIRGFRVTLITQRPATIHKNVLTQANTLLAMRLTSPQDRKAVEEWVKGNADDMQAKEVLGSLASLKRGTGWLWFPSGGVLEKRAFPKIKTFDSSRSPEEGEHAIEPVALAPVDVEELRRALDPAPSNEKAKSNTPSKMPAPAVDIEAVREKAFKEGFVVGLNAARSKFLAAAIRARDAANEAVNGLNHAIELPPGADSRSTGFPESAPQVNLVAERNALPKASVAPKSSSRRKPAAGNGLDAAAVKLLGAFKRYPQRGLTWEEACTVAGLVPGNGYFYGGRKQLLEGMHVVDHGEGRCVLNDPDDAAGTPATRAEIKATWSKLKQPAPLMLEYLIDRARPVLTRELAAAVNLKPGNGYWYGGLAKLREAGLIEDAKGSIKLSAFVQEAK